MQTQYKTEFETLKNEIEINLDKFIPIKYPEQIYDSMRYSVLAGGKRLRPVLTLEVARLISGSYQDALPSACAVEMLHCQSLIHDDLPCMDNDDIRRGKPTNHKVYGEATAVLAGDALLSFAPQVILEHTPDCISQKQVLDVLKEFFIAAGVEGIIAGQVVDIDSEGKQIDKKTLDYIHEYKTAKLFTFAIRAGAIIANASESELNDWTKFAHYFGHAFQIYDDILDEIATLEEIGKTPGKDKKVLKNTYTSMHGLEKARAQVKLLCSHACDILKINKYNSPIINGIISDIIERIA